MIPPGSSPSDTRTRLAKLMQTVKAVFFDFDGPLCDVFSGHPAARVAEELKIVANQFSASLPGSLRTSSDPHAILRSLSVAGLCADNPERNGELLSVLEETLTQHEIRAARTAKPTTHAFELVVALHERGKRLLVTSNNASDAVREHLHAESLDDFFGHVVGRVPGEPALMKPHPHCVHRALELVSLLPQECLLIGDQPTDAEAARAAGVPFVGYAPDAAVFRDTATEDTVPSLEILLQVLPPLD